MNVAVALLLIAPETPVNVTVYVPGAVFLGNKIPETASAEPFVRCIVIGKSSQEVPAGPPEQLSLMLPLKPVVERTSSMKAARPPTTTVSALGFGVIV